MLRGHGYYVLVNNLFCCTPLGPGARPSEHIGEEARPAIFAELMPLIEAHATERVLRVGAGPVAVTGYCIGGLLATRTAAAHPEQVAALAAFHAPVHAAGADDLHRLTARVHFGHAESDLTPEALDELNQTLDAAGVDYTSEIYPGTVHGFTMSDTDAFDPAALRRHWDRLLPLLAERP
jgi:carboxymethylenebutenolidase